MTTQSYAARRHQLETYFDRTAVDAWARLTSDAPVGRIRATVRAGRDQMRRVAAGARAAEDADGPKGHDDARKQLLCPVI